MKKKSEVYYEALRELGVATCVGCYKQLEDNERGEQMCINPECEYNLIPTKEV